MLGSEYLTSATEQTNKHSKRCFEAMSKLYKVIFPILGEDNVIQHKNHLLPLPKKKLFVKNLNNNYPRKVICINHETNKGEKCCFSPPSHPG